MIGGTMGMPGGPPIPNVEKLLVYVLVLVIGSLALLRWALGWKAL